MTTKSINTADATYVVWMIAATGRRQVHNLMEACAVGAGFDRGLLTTWKLPERHFSGGTHGVWVLVAAAQDEADAKAFVAGRREMEPDCALEVIRAWPKHAGRNIPKGRGFNVERGWLVVFPSPLMTEEKIQTNTEEAPKAQTLN